MLVKPFDPVTVQLGAILYAIQPSRKWGTKKCSISGKVVLISIATTIRLFGRQDGHNPSIVFWRYFPCETDGECVPAPLVVGHRLRGSLIREMELPIATTYLSLSLILELGSNWA